MSEHNKGQVATKWYDGFLYDKLITPRQNKTMGQIEELVADNCTVIDVGCGPGALAIRLSAKCRRVVGLDRSERMIAYARRQLAKNGASNVEFVCDDAAEMRTIHNERFTFAVISMCLHGMSHDTRQKVLETCCKLAEKIVLVDYVAPFPENMIGRAQNIIEALEGKDTYPNFREWQRSGGIDAFVRNAGLRVEKDKPWGDGFGKTILVTK
jgi:ubiquinone/menaquinone biosynthesis C-methylase UbiE